MAEHALPSPVRETPAGDLGRRLVLRRTRLGLTREETATHARVATTCLRHLEEHSEATPGAGTLLRLAQVLECTATELMGGDAEEPPGPGRAVRDAAPAALDLEECRRLLGTHGVGRVAVATAQGPAIVPVNYSVVDGDVVFRAEPHSTPARAAGRRVAFEVDRIDEAFSRGWSVLLQGTARAVTHPEELYRLTEWTHSEPWAGGRRTLWLRLHAAGVTGRRITT